VAHQRSPIADGYSSCWVTDTAYGRRLPV